MTDAIHLDDSRRFLVIGPRRWPVSLAIWEDLDIPQDETSLDHALVFKTRVCRVAFENGWALSVGYGSCMYGDNYHHGAGPHHTPDFIEEPHVVEAVIFHRDGMVGEPRAADARTLTNLLAIMERLPSDIDAARAQMADWVSDVEDQADS